MSGDEDSVARPAEGFSEVNKELEDIMENEVKYDSDGVARGHSPGRPPSAGGSVSSSNSGSRSKRRTWKKPKDKPKRPLSAYNIFFKHERSRIVEGRPEECTAEEIIRSIESILSTSRETRRHRKTHGRISFGDLARKIAEKWKIIGPEQKAVFEHYAELDMRRYRKEVKMWKDRKENEAYSRQAMMDGSANASLSSLDSEADYNFENFTGAGNSDDAWAPRRTVYDSMNSSFSSVCSVDSEFSLEPIPIGEMVRNARSNMSASLPNIDMELGVPGFVNAAAFSSNISNNTMNQQISSMNPQISSFDNQSLSLLQFQMNQGLHMDSQIPQLVGSSVNPSAAELERLRQENTLQQQQLQRQQHILLRQQQLLQQQLQQTNQMMRTAGMNPTTGAQLQASNMPFGLDQNAGIAGEGTDLENYLSGLDLSNL